jgi:NAD(P)-dependent dehydrogenase (short-subunit alcohol dehydrogenase family)
VAFLHVQSLVCLTCHCSQQFTPHNRTAPYPSIDPTNPANSLAGKVAIITGASRGLGGEGLVPVFAKAGVKGLVLVATNGEKLKSIESSVKKAHPQIETLVIAADVSNSASVDSLFAQVKAKFGHAGILVNNAAVLTGGGLLHEEDPSKWWKNFVSPGFAASFM